MKEIMIKLSKEVWGSKYYLNTNFKEKESSSDDEEDWNKLEHPEEW